MSIKRLKLAIQQSLYKQVLQRKPEMDLVMSGYEQDLQYTLDGSQGSLAILYELVVDWLLRLAPKSGKGLDLCCGSGQLLCRIAQALPEVSFTGVDLSSHMLEFTNSHLQELNITNVSTRIGNMYKLAELLDESFDLITWNLALHHCDDEKKVVEVLTQLKKLLKPEGTLFIFDINRPKTGKIALGFAELYNQTWGDWYFHDSLDSYKAAFTFTEMKQILHSSGLTEYLHFGPIIGPFFQFVVVNPWGMEEVKRKVEFPHLWQLMDYSLLRILIRWGYAYEQRRYPK